MIVLKTLNIFPMIWLYQQLNKLKNYMPHISLLLNTPQNLDTITYVSIF